MPKNNKHFNGGNSENAERARRSVFPKTIVSLSAFLYEHRLEKRFDKLPMLCTLTKKEIAREIEFSKLICDNLIMDNECQDSNTVDEDVVTLPADLENEIDIMTINCDKIRNAVRKILSE